MRKKETKQSRCSAKKIIFLGISTICVFALNSCGNMDSSMKSQIVDEETQMEETQTEDVSLYSDIASELVEKLNIIDSYAAGIFGYDESNVFENLDGSRQHAKVTDGYFSNTDEFRSYIDSALTEQLLSEQYSYLFDGDGMNDDGPRFYDIDSVLYGEITRARNGGFTLVDYEPDISSITDTSFTADFRINNNGEETSLSLDIVLADGTWKINDFTGLY